MNYVFPQYATIKTTVLYSSGKSETDTDSQYVRKESYFDGLKERLHYYIIPYYDQDIISCSVSLIAKCETEKGDEYEKEVASLTYESK